MKHDESKLKEMMEELNFEMLEELDKDDSDNVTEMIYVSSTWMESINFPEISLVDSENYPLYDDEDGTAKEKALKAIYETTSKLEEVIKAYNIVLKRNLETFEKISEQIDEEDFPLTMSPENWKASSESLKLFLEQREKLGEQKALDLNMDPEVLKQVKELMGDTDLDKPGVFDNRRFDQ